jgi:DNA-binding transcriptional MerR regulator
MTKRRTFTLDEIERETGFDRRTIAYYVQEELLPRVGRRGPRTRYSCGYLNRLLFIRRVRELQDQGELGNLTLGDIREIFDQQPEERIAEVVTGRTPIAHVLPEGVGHPSTADMAPASRRADTLRRSRRRRTGLAHGREAGMSMSASVEALSRQSVPSPEEDAEPTLVLDLDEGPPVFELREVGDPVPTDTVAHQPSRPDLETVARLLRSLSEAAGTAGRRGHRSSERWTRARITPGMSISARNLDEGDAPLLERLALELRRLISGGPGGHG